MRTEGIESGIRILIRTGETLPSDMRVEATIILKISDLKIRVTKMSDVKQFCATVTKSCSGKHF